MLLLELNSSKQPAFIRLIITFFFTELLGTLSTKSLNEVYGLYLNIPLQALSPTLFITLRGNLIP